MSERKHIIGKLAQVMSELNRVPKRGYNKHFRYEYVMEADLVDAVRQKLADLSVMLISDVEEVSVDERSGENGTRYITAVKMRFTFVDAESGEEVSFLYVGQGEDSGDKGVYKAYTGALKYALMKNFLMGTGDDVEADSRSEEEARRNAQSRANRPARPARPVEPAQPAQPAKTASKTAESAQPAPSKENMDQIRKAMQEEDDIPDEMVDEMYEEIKKKFGNGDGAKAKSMEAMVLGLYKWAENDLGLDPVDIQEAWQQISGEVTFKGMSPTINELKKWKLKLEARKATSG